MVNFKRDDIHFFTDDQKAEMQEVTKHLFNTENTSAEEHTGYMERYCELDRIGYRQFIDKLKAQTYDEIMTAVQRNIDATSPEEYTAGIEYVQKQLANFPDLLTRFYSRDYAGYFYYLESMLNPYKTALQEAGHDLTPFVEAIDKAAAEAFPDTERTVLVKDASGEWLRFTPEHYAEHLADPSKTDRTQHTLPTFTNTKIDKLGLPLDKVNSYIWSLSEQDTGKQLLLAAEKTGSKQELNILYSIDFDGLADSVSITRSLNAYDKRVYIAAASLFNAGQDYITPTQIYYAMGYSGKPGRNGFDRINASINKMRSANIRITNSEEAAFYNYEKFEYQGYLLPCEQIRAYANGQVTNSVLHLLKEPPMMAFARQRKQITSIDVKLLQSPVSKTDTHLIIEGYLLERIAHAKRGGAQPRILYKTIFEKANITTKKQQRDREKATIQKYLDHYKKTGFISNYALDNDGIKVFFQHRPSGVEPEAQHEE